jgi:putative two-component system response regulator
VTAKVLLVDDEEPVRWLEDRLLTAKGYSCAMAADVPEALEKLQQEAFDLALVDVNMPGASGLDLVRQISNEYPNTASVMVTGVDDYQVANAALEMGAYGYLIKPFENNELLIHVANALRRRDLEAENRAHRQRLEQMVEARTSQLTDALERLRQSEKDVRASQEETVVRLARAAESRDSETGEHLHRMSRYCALLARRCGLSPERCEQIRLASFLHDVGKIGIPDRILLKPGPFTPEEFDIMKLHVDLGYRTLSHSKSDLLNLAATIARTHHEKYDGSGYNSGLSGKQIPLEGRIAAIADAFDALASHRVYKPALPIENVVSILKDGRGKDFDPILVDLFLGGLDEVLAIKYEYADRSPVSDQQTAFGRPECGLAAEVPAGRRV